VSGWGGDGGGYREAGTKVKTNIFARASFGHKALPGQTHRLAVA